MYISIFCTLYMAYNLTSVFFFFFIFKFKTTSHTEITFWAVG